MTSVWILLSHFSSLSSRSVHTPRSLRKPDNEGVNENATMLGKTRKFPARLPSRSSFLSFSVCCASGETKISGEYITARQDDGLSFLFERGGKLVALPDNRPPVVINGTQPITCVIFAAGGTLSRFPLPSPHLLL